MREPSSIPDPGDLVQRLDMATVASCTCIVKTPEIEAHDAMCRYRLLRESAAVLRVLIKGLP